jgi:nucleotide-binding universal stress UspA family protein
LNDLKRILVPLDGSELAEKSLAVVADMVAPGIEIVFLRIVSPLSLVTGNDAMIEAKRYLDGLVDDWSRRHSPEVSAMVVEGSAAEQIIDQAEALGAGLIVMTTHGSGGLGRWLVGSCAERVVRHAHCPVLTIGKRALSGP